VLLYPNRREDEYQPYRPLVGRVLSDGGEHVCARQEDRPLGTEMLVNGHTRDVQIDANGTVLEIEEQVDLRALPADVQAGLHAKAGKGNIMKVGSITKKDK
jgi:hypothetical protein